MKYRKENKMNNWTGIGRLVRDPEVRYTTEQMAICKFTMAIDDGYGDKKKTNFIPVVVFGKTAENCERFLAKGRMVAVEGKIQTGSYEKDGTKVYTTDVIANRVEFIDFGNKNGQNAKQDGSEAIPEGFAVMDDNELPF
jgi:single-strand DNA-binding protein